jgi:hypothetical protein
MFSIIIVTSSYQYLLKNKNFSDHSWVFDNYYSNILLQVFVNSNCFAVQNNWSVCCVNFKISKFWQAKIQQNFWIKFHLVSSLCSDAIFELTMILFWGLLIFFLRYDCFNKILIYVQHRNSILIGQNTIPENKGEFFLKFPGHNIILFREITECEKMWAVGIGWVGGGWVCNAKITVTNAKFSSLKLLIYEPIYLP